MTPVEIFYTPHTDDEVLGMGGAIAEASANGHRVVLVLVTDNKPSVRATDLFTDRLRCHWHLGAKHDLGHIDLVAARLLEFTEAATILGANEIAALGIPEQMGLDDYPRYVEAIGIALHRYAIMYPGATHHVVQSVADYHQDSGRGNMSHDALAQAARVHRAEFGALLFHRVYIYSLPAVQRVASITKTLVPEIMAIKRRAMDAYKVFDPANGRIAYGYHSVRDLFDGAASDAREFLEAA